MGGCCSHSYRSLWEKACPELVEGSFHRGGLGLCYRIKAIKSFMLCKDVAITQWPIGVITNQIQLEILNTIL